MLYLTTGANGAGKTLCTLQDVRAQQEKELRPVYFNGFEMDEDTRARFGWIHWPDPTKWMEIPEGSIVLFDECQEHFGKSSSREPPQYILDLAKYRRKRGIDMWLITPHPSMLHVDVRRLIESPSWHRHIKRAFGADMVSVTTYSVPNLRCEEGSTDDKGAMTMRPFPKEVYKWYRSASLHTGKRKIPRSVWILLGAISLIPVLAYFAWGSIREIGNPDKITKSVLGTPAPGATSQFPPAGRSASIAPMSSEQYAAMRAPRFAGFPHTAPVYDAITLPVRAPYPAACIESRTRCVCHSDQGTRLDIPRSVCSEIVKGGFYVDWDLPDSRGSTRAQGATGTSEPDSRGPGRVSSLPGTSGALPAQRDVSMQSPQVEPASQAVRAPGELL